MTTVFCFTENLARYAAPAIHSVLSNNPTMKVTLFTETDEYPFYQHKNITVVNVKKSELFGLQDTGLDAWPYMANVRLILTKLLPKENTVLYLDVDTIVDADISDLFKLKLGDDYIAACVEDPAYCIRKGVTDYVNSGVLLMNLKKIREDKLDDVWLEKAKRTKDGFPDQDIINDTCKGRIRFLPREYNYRTSPTILTMPESDGVPKIWHFAGVRCYRRTYSGDYPIYAKYADVIKYDHEISPVIMGVKSRAENIKRTQELLPGAKVVFDTKQSVLDTARRAWTAPAKKSATHRLVLQDDVELCDDFMGILNEIVDMHPDAVITLCSWDFMVRNRHLEGKRSPYWGCKNISGQGNVMPLSYVNECWDWIDENLGGKYGDDYSMYLWAQHKGIECIQLIPSIVQHVSESSVINPAAEKRNWQTHYYNKQPQYDWAQRTVYKYPWRD